MSAGAEVSWREDYAHLFITVVLGVCTLVCVEVAALATGVASGAPRWLLIGTGDVLDVVAAPLGIPAPAGSTTAYLFAVPGLFRNCLLTTAVALTTGVAAAGWAVTRRRGRGTRSTVRHRRQRRWGGPVTDPIRTAAARLTPTPPGHATAAQIRAELSVAACRESAARTRPSMSPAQIRAAAPGEVGIPLPICAACGQLWAPFTNPTGVIATTQSGKTRCWLCGICIDAPGALLCSTTKPDLLELSALSRARRPGAGPVWVFDLTGTTTWPATLPWSPLHGCRDQQQAWATAKRLVEAAATTIEAGGGRGAGNDRVFRQRAIGVVGAYLLAAAHTTTTAADGGGGSALSRIADWATDRTTAHEAVNILTSHSDYAHLAAALKAELSMVAETADAVWMSVRRALEPFSDPRVRRLCDIDPDTSYDLEAFITAGGALYLIAEDNDAAAIPILTTIVDEWITTARRLALTRPGRRLDPPATIVLDELPSATPVPDLPTMQADSAGRGVLIHWAAQSLSQLDAVYGTRARDLIENSTVFAVWGGIKDDDTLTWLSKIIGDRTTHRDTHPTGGLLPPTHGGSRTTERVPIYPPAAIRTLPRGEVLILYRHLPVIRATTTDAYHRPDGNQLRADVATIASGNIPITPTGYLDHQQ
ncbi:MULTISPECIES: type IV secretory system conjugative DNA transfer family protein [unclassified Pseudonocardia]|uniref:type IV secretory system conjugative DNA transfer family protein n=2 Tax=Pseudonocardia TaxID=1847 RepID=UPI00094B4D39|nr:TraM recognition domain-containing protein [Pseudonocardia sp. Ae331_Ps2]OLL89536.1 putative traG-family protein [Pseudonocardia sp. Ae331_Ps2]